MRAVTRLGGRRLYVAAPIAAAALFILVGMGTPGRASDTALLEVVSDRVFLRQGRAAQEQVVEPTRIKGGDVIRTNAFGRALLTYSDGSTVIIYEDSEFTFHVVRRGLFDTVTLMLQTAGRAWYSIARIFLPGTRYELVVPGGAAVVRAGSAFGTIVEEDGSTTIDAESGSVNVTASGRVVEIRGGQRTVVRPGHAPSAPTEVPPSTRPGAKDVPSATAVPGESAAPQAPARAGTPDVTSVPNAASPAPTASAPAPTSLVPTPTLPPTPTPSLAPTPTPTPSGTPLPTLPPLPTGLPTPTLPLGPLP